MFLKFHEKIHYLTSIRHLIRSEVVTAEGVTVRADNVVVATNVPINDRFVMATKYEPYRTYVITTPVPKDAIPRALYWDSADPYH